MTFLAITGAAVLVWAVIVGRFVDRTRRMPPTPPPASISPRLSDPPISERPRREGVRAHWPSDVQILFAEHSGRTLQLDCVVLDDRSAGLPAGTPVALHLAEPASPPLAALVDATVDQWAERSEVVDLEVRWRARGTRVHLSDGTRSMNLDVELVRSY